MNKEKEKTSFASKMGAFFGNVVVACIGISLAACVVALTVRFINLLF